MTSQMKVLIPWNHFSLLVVRPHRMAPAAKWIFLLSCVTSSCTFDGIFSVWRNSRVLYLMFSYTAVFSIPTPTLLEEWWLVGMEILQFQVGDGITLTTLIVLIKGVMEQQGYTFKYFQVFRGIWASKITYFSLAPSELPSTSRLAHSVHIDVLEIQIPGSRRNYSTMWNEKYVCAWGITRKCLFRRPSPPSVNMGSVFPSGMVDSIEHMALPSWKQYIHMYPREVGHMPSAPQ